MVVVRIVDLLAEVVGLSGQELIILDFIDLDLLLRVDQDHAIQIVHLEVSPASEAEVPGCRPIGQVLLREDLEGFRMYQQQSLGVLA